MVKIDTFLPAKQRAQIANCLFLFHHITSLSMLSMYMLKPDSIAIRTTTINSGPSMPLQVCSVSRVCRRIPWLERYQVAKLFAAKNCGCHLFCFCTLVEILAVRETWQLNAQMASSYPTGLKAEHITCNQIFLIMLMGETMPEENQRQLELSCDSSFLLDLAT